VGNNKIPDIKLRDVTSALESIESYWRTYKHKATKTNTTLIPLPNPYIVPSSGEGDFAFNEQFYWDSYFIALGLDNEKLVTGMLDNLVFMFNKFGLIPNGNRYYFTSRSQPPMLTTFILHVYEKYHKPKSWLKKYIAVAKREYHEVWTSEHHPHFRKIHEGLSRYYDINFLHDLAEAESGWDMTPRFQRRCLDFLPIDLNCMLYKYEADFAHCAALLGDDSEARVWRYAANHRKNAVNKLMWNKRKAFFFDYNHIDNKQSDVYSLASYYMLWSGMADDQQAEKLVQQLVKFEKPGGLTTTHDSFMHPHLFGSAKTQWAYPNGWAPLHQITVEGLENYGYSEQAERIAKKWLTTCNDWYIQSGEFLEKYNVVNPDLPPSEGLYPSQTGFGWTNAVFANLAQKYLK